MQETEETQVQSLGWEDSPGEHRNPPRYSYVENAMDRGAWWATVHRLTESDTTEVTLHVCIQVFHKEIYC